MVCDVLCTFGPQDRPFEEKAPCVFITAVAAGSFHCRSAAGCSLLTPGSWMLGHANQCFERRLEPGTGVRCLSFRYAPGYFERLVGVTPHRYILRARLREAAMRLEAESTGILDIALDCGFSDLSNFSRAFRVEFGVSPRAYRGVTKNRLGEVREN